MIWNELSHNFIICFALSLLALAGPLHVGAQAKIPVAMSCDAKLTENYDVWQLSRNWTERMAAYVRHVQPTKGSRDDEAAESLLELMPQVRTVLLLHAAAEADRMENSMRSFVLDAPWNVQLHSDTWQAMSDSLDERIKKAREETMAPVRLLDQLHDLVQQKRVPTMPNPAPFETVKIKSALSSERLMSQWSEATDPIANADPKRSRFFGFWHRSGSTS